MVEHTPARDLSPLEVARGLNSGGLAASHTPLQVARMLFGRRRHPLGQSAGPSSQLADSRGPENLGVPSPPAGSRTDRGKGPAAELAALRQHAADLEAELARIKSQPTGGSEAARRLRRALGRLRSAKLAQAVSSWVGAYADECQLQAVLSSTTESMNEYMGVRLIGSLFTGNARRQRAALLGMWYRRAFDSRATTAGAELEGQIRQTRLLAGVNSLKTANDRLLAGRILVLVHDWRAQAADARLERLRSEFEVLSKWSHKSAATSEIARSLHVWYLNFARCKFDGLESAQLELEVSVDQEQQTAGLRMIKQLVESLAKTARRSLLDIWRHKACQASLQLSALARTRLLGMELESEICSEEWKVQSSVDIWRRRAGSELMSRHLQDQDQLEGLAKLVAIQGKQVAASIQINSVLIQFSLQYRSRLLAAWRVQAVKGKIKLMCRELEIMTGKVSSKNRKLADRFEFKTRSARLLHQWHSNVLSTKTEIMETQLYKSLVCARLQPILDTTRRLRRESLCQTVALCVWHDRFLRYKEADHKSVVSDLHLAVSIQGNALSFEKAAKVKAQRLSASLRNATARWIYTRCVVSLMSRAIRRWFAHKSEALASLSSEAQMIASEAKSTSLGLHLSKLKDGLNEGVERVSLLESALDEKTNLLIESQSHNDALEIRSCEYKLTCQELNDRTRRLNLSVVLMSIRVLFFQQKSAVLHCILSWHGYQQSEALAALNQKQRVQASVAAEASVMEQEDRVVKVLLLALLRCQLCQRSMRTAVNNWIRGCHFFVGATQVDSMSSSYTDLCPDWAAVSIALRSWAKHMATCNADRVKSQLKPQLRNANHAQRIIAAQIMQRQKRSKT